MTDKIESQRDFGDTPEEWQRYWTVEMDAAKEDSRKFLERGDRVVRRFVDDRGVEQSTGSTRVNLFTSNVQTLRSLLYGQTPKVSVKRRYADPADDVGRVAGEILQRMLNTDIERDSDTFAEALANALDDRLIPGLGIVRVRYVADFEEVEPPGEEPGEAEAEEAPEPKKLREDVDVDHVNWRDFRWSPCRTFAEMRWAAFRVPMSRDELVDRFGEDMAKRVPLTAKEAVKDESDAQKHDPWTRAEVWEIWSKEHLKVFWWVSGAPGVLEVQDDPLELAGFWPFPRPMAANTTTAKWMPTPDFTLAQDLYDEIDSVSTRITLLERAVAVRGVYDQTSTEVKRILSEAVSNDMIPAENFALFKDKGGLAGVVDWLPLEMVVGALDKLREYRGELITLLYQVTGMSDIMRGQSSGATTATEQAIKAKFASVRVQSFQDEFARFASDTQKIKAEVISKFFDPQTIAERANVQGMIGVDPGVAQQAISLVKSRLMAYRVEVKPEQVAMADYAAIKEERSAFLMAVATFLQSSAPLMQAAPWSGPYLLQMLQWAMAGFRDGASVEGVLDQMVLTAQRALAAPPPPPQPDPAMQTAMVKAQAEQFKAKADVQQTILDHQVKKAELGMQMQKAQMDHSMTMQRAEVKMREDAMQSLERVAPSQGVE